MAHQANVKRARGKRSAECEPVPVASLPKTRYNLRSQGPPNYAQFADQECPICLEEYSSPITIVNCGHSFCSECIEKCIEKGSSKTCPVCKKRLVNSLFINCEDFTKRVTKKYSTSNRHSTVSRGKKFEAHLAQQRKTII